MGKPIAQGCLAIIVIGICIAYFSSEFNRLKDVRNFTPPKPTSTESVPIPSPSPTPSAEQKEKDRKASLAAAVMNAKAVSGDKTKCALVGPIATALAGVRLIRRDDAEWRHVAPLVPRLEACRKKAAANAFSEAANAGATARQAWAEKAERIGLDNNMDMTFTLLGDARDDLRVKWVLMNRVTVHQITKAGSMDEGAFLRQAQDLGFREVTFTDGYHFYDTRELQPPYRLAVATTLANQGLANPLTLESVGGR